MKSPARAVRVVLASLLIAAPAAAQVVRVGEMPVAPASNGAASVVGGANALPLFSAPGASALSLSAASLPTAPSLNAPALNVAPAASLAAPAPSASPEAIERYRRLKTDLGIVRAQLNTPDASVLGGDTSIPPMDAVTARRLSDEASRYQKEMDALVAANPSVAYDASGPIARAWARLTGAAPSLQALDRMPAAAAGRGFDGAKEKAAAPAEDDVEAGIPEDLPTDVADAAPQLLELFVTRESKGGIRKGTLEAQIGLIKSKGSEWYWGKFTKGATIALKSGMNTLFVSKVTAAKTIKIGSMRREDFVGVFTAQRMAGKSVYDLRRALIQELKDRQERRPGAPTPVSSQSSVRIVRFLNATKARELPENRDESAYPVAPREAVTVPTELAGLHNLLPKTVVLDMRLFPNGVPYPMIEDMSKLMKAGVYFLLLSDKPNAGPGSVEDLLTKQLSAKQRDQISRYKMVILSDDGNSLSGYSGNFSRGLPSKRFEPLQLETIAFVATSQGAVVDAKSTRVEAVFPKGTDGAKAREALIAGMRGMRQYKDEWQVSVGERGGKTVVTVRPQNLASAIPHALEIMRDQEGVYANNSDMMLISRDPALREALKGAVQAADHFASDGEKLADESLAALLGPYRENKPGDLAASASKISSFLQGRDGSGGGGFGNVYMMTGHVMHSAFNWAIWKYRNEGVLPDAAATVAMGRQIWEDEVAKSGAKNLLSRSGESLAGFYETVEKRLTAMHAIAAEVLVAYPIAVGTELPNLFVADRYKKGGELDHRDIFRLIFDFVVARETADGKIEIAIVDFKTGQVPVLQSLEKDTQVQLYDLLVRQMWKRLPLPYGANGTPREVSDVKLKFLYTAGAYQPNMNDWSRLKFDKFLKNVMNRIRRHNAPPAPKKDDAKGGKTAAPKGKTAPKAKA